MREATNQSQLHDNIPDLRLRHYFKTNSVLVTREANDMPFIFWPDERKTPCNMANLFMIKLFRAGLSRRGRGGTLSISAGKISHLIRFCYVKKLDFIQMDDSLFVQFMNKLRKESSTFNPSIKKRNSNTFNDIGATCLRFLDFVGGQFGDSEFVINSIRAEKKLKRIQTDKSSRGFIEQAYFYHHSFDTADPKKKRMPISEGIIFKLYESIPSISNSKFLYRRRIALLRILEATGARIGEIALLKVEDIENALKDGEHLLKLVTFKKKKESVRYVPVLMQDLDDLKTYIDIHRYLIIKKKLKKSKDHGFIFVSEKTGCPISSAYMSNEIGILRRAINIDVEACAHMFRHRYITKLFIIFINKHECENKDDFRRALLDGNIIKQQIKEYTGHTLTSSL